MNAFGKFKIKGMSFVSFDELTNYCILSNINKNSTFYLPVIYKTQNKLSNLSIKSDILIVANYRYAPNVYALNWFLDNCIDKIVEAKPDVMLMIVGRGLNEELSSKIKTYKNAIPIGEVDSVDEYYRGTKLVVIPLFQGAGVKIKLLEAVSYDCPIVCTTKTLEGTRFNNECVNVADDANTFIKNVLNVLDSYDQAIEKAKKAKNIFNEDYDEDKLSQKLYEFITK